MSRKKSLQHVLSHAAGPYRDAVDRGLMQVTLRGRDGKRVVLPDGREVTEFVNCSYLGLDTHPDVIAAAREVVGEWGVHFCCARSRFTIGPNGELEEGLSQLFGGRAITFPSVTSAHMSTLPLLAAGELFPDGQHRSVRLIFDRFAHASMQYLKPVLAQDATVTSIPHNDMAALRAQLEEARAAGETGVYVTDGVYSMGGVCPLPEALALAEELDAWLYVDDAHGTSIYGERGVGFLLSQTGAVLPRRVIATYSLAKGFGTNGGGVLVPTEAQEQLIRSFGQTYAFSAPLDFSIVAAALAALELHHDGSVAELQRDLRAKVARFDRARGLDLPFSPIRMVPLSSSDEALRAGERLIDEGFFVTVAMYPVVPRDQPQLRVCVTSAHSEDEVDGLTDALDRVLAR